MIFSFFVAIWIVSSVFTNRLAHTASENRTLRHDRGAKDLQQKVDDSASAPPFLMGTWCKNSLKVHQVFQANCNTGRS